MERQLTAILSADVEGYSRLMGEDVQQVSGLGLLLCNIFPLALNHFILAPALMRPILRIGFA